MLVDSPPYTPTTHTFFPVHPQNTRPTSPQYPGPTSLEYFPSSPAYSPTSLSDLLAELFKIRDLLAGVEEVEPPVDIVEPPIELEEVIVPPCRRRCRVERSLLWEITGSLAAAGHDLRVGKELLFSKPKIVVK